MTLVPSPQNSLTAKFVAPSSRARPVSPCAGAVWLEEQKVFFQGREVRKGRSEVFGAVPEVLAGHISALLTHWIDEKVSGSSGRTRTYNPSVNSRTAATIDRKTKSWPNRRRGRAIDVRPE